MLRTISILTAVLLAMSSLACGKSEDVSAKPAAPRVVVAPVEQQDVEIFSEWVGTTTGYVNAQIFPKTQQGGRGAGTNEALRLPEYQSHEQYVRSKARFASHTSMPSPVTPTTAIWTTSIVPMSG